MIWLYQVTLERMPNHSKINLEKQLYVSLCCDDQKAEFIASDVTELSILPIPNLGSHIAFPENNFKVGKCLAFKRSNKLDKKDIAL